MRRLAANPYLNIPPTKLKRMLEDKKLNKKEKDKIKKALEAWRTIGEYARFLSN